MKEKIKQYWNKGKAFCKKHYKGILITAIGLVGATIGITAVKKRNNDDYYECTNNFDPGRDCKMIFEVDDESKEFLGEVPCTESYAKDMIECFSDSKISE